MKVPPSLYYLLFLSIFFTGAVLSRVEAYFQWRYPRLDELAVSNSYAGDLGALLLGAHRVAADIVYIQFLQYYGVHHEHDKEGHHVEFGAGDYPLVKEFGTRLLRLDPYFNAAILEIAGALAYNLKETSESLEFLREAIERDPSFYRYRLYVGAILYKNAGQEKQMVRLLKEAIQAPDCPAIVQNILGNLLVKMGDYKEAALVYLHTYQTVPNEWDQKTALAHLRDLLKGHPEVASVLGEAGAVSFANE